VSSSRIASTAASLRRSVRAERGRGLAVPGVVRRFTDPRIEHEAGTVGHGRVVREAESS
jgi:hypothetical protein